MMGPWLLYQLMNGGTIALFTGMSTNANFMRFVQDAKVNCLGVVPSIVKAWRSVCDKTAAATSAHYWPYDWSSVTRFSSTGEASDAESSLWLMSRVPEYAPIIEYCGGTEIAGSFLSSTMLQPNVPAMFSLPVCGSRVCILGSSNEVIFDDNMVRDRSLHADDDCETHTGEIALIPPSMGR